MLDYTPITEKTGYVIMEQSLVLLHDISDKETVLIDSGYFESPELLELLKARGKTVPAVLCTHLHVDHDGNNGLMQRKFGAKIYIGKGEKKVHDERYNSDVEVPFSWMSREQYFFGDSGKYDMTVIEDDVHEVKVGETVFSVERLPGHSPDHLGFGTPDGILMVADAVMTDSVLRKSKIPYELNITKAIKTLEMIPDLGYEQYAASHMGMITCEDIKRVCDDNLKLHNGMLMEIERRLNGWQNLDKFVNETIANRGVHMRLTRNRGWIPAAICSYIDHLIREGRVVMSREPSSDGIITGKTTSEVNKIKTFIKRTI